MHIALLSREYPPHVYGGAGVHVDYLSRALSEIESHQHEIEVLCFGDQGIQPGNLKVRGIDPDFQPPFQDEKHKLFMKTLLTDIVMAGSLAKADLIHCHTWYSHLAGLILKQLTGAPLVLTTHSLEPHRPWKREQLGSAYNGSSWIEKTAFENCDGVIAVSQAMKKDVQSLYRLHPQKIRVIHNGIDLDQYKVTFNQDLLESYEIDPSRPYVLFVGRITRQKGIIHLANALKHLKKDIQVVLCAGAPDTEEIAREMKQRVEEARHQTKSKIIWIRKMLPKEEVITLYSHASLFVCPSVYEPFGIINLEAMACETPVVASAVGGIPEIVIPNETGLLVPVKMKRDNNHQPENPEKFSRDLARAINQLMSSPEALEETGKKSRKRVEEYFSWNSIANQTLDFYRDLISKRNKTRVK